MPLITVKMLDGRTQEQKRELAKALTDAMVETCGAQREGTSVVIEEVTRGGCYPFKEDHILHFFRGTSEFGSHIERKNRRR